MMQHFKGFVTKLKGYSLLGKILCSLIYFRWSMCCSLWCLVSRTTTHFQCYRRAYTPTKVFLCCALWSCCPKLLCKWVFISALQFSEELRQYWKSYHQSVPSVLHVFLSMEMLIWCNEHNNAETLSFDRPLIYWSTFSCTLSMKQGGTFTPSM